MALEMSMLQLVLPLQACNIMKVWLRYSEVNPEFEASLLT